MKTVLVVDDDEAIRTGLIELIALLLGDEMGGAPLRVLGAGDGERAEELAAVEAPDVVLMDVSLPGNDGIEVFDRIRAARGGTAPPTLFITGFVGGGAVHDRLQRAVADGAIGFVSKPVSGSELIALIRPFVLEGVAEKA